MTIRSDRTHAAHRWLDWHVATILLVALALRIGAWWVLPYTGYISDEKEYLAAATWLAEGRNFSFFQNWIWTRPPLYVMFLAAHIKLFDPQTLWPIRLSQAIFSTISVWLVMQLGARLAPTGHERRVALTAGWIMALAYGLAIYSFLLLSETLFITLLLAAVLALTMWAQENSVEGRRSKVEGRSDHAIRPMQQAVWSYRWLIVGGVLLGLGSLTRAVLAGALPLIAVWVFVQRLGIGNWGFGIRRTIQNPKSKIQNGIIAAALLTIVVSIVILPWSFYNTRLYNASSLILIDTTGGYNAMLGAQPGHQEVADLSGSSCNGRPPRCEKDVYNYLSQFPDHSVRQTMAYRKAAEWIAENPAGFVRKTGYELLDMLWINYGGDERLADGYALGRIPAPHLLGLLLDDTLYLLAAPLVLLGLFRRQCRAGKGLILIWLLYNFVVGPLTFAINRFRVPLLPFLLIYAAIGLWSIRSAWSSERRRWLGIGAAVAIALLLLPSYLYFPPILDPGRRSSITNTIAGFRGLRDAAGCATVERLFEQGDLEAAQAAHDAENQRLFAAGVPQANARRDCLALLQAQIWARQSKPDQALALLSTMREIPQRYLIEGDIYRSIGQTERARGEDFGPFVATRLEPANPTTWAWDHLNPPPTDRIDLGNGLDWGYIDGFYQREYPQGSTQPFEEGYRWTGPQARLKFLGAGTGRVQTLRLRVNGYRYTGFDPARLTVIQDGAELRTIDLPSSEWQEIAVDLPPTPAGADVIVELRSTVFVDGPEALQALQQLRLLGVQVDWAELEDQG